MKATFKYFFPDVPKDRLYGQADYARVNKQEAPNKVLEKKQKTEARYLKDLEEKQKAEKNCIEAKKLFPEYFNKQFVESAKSNETTNGPIVIRLPSFFTLYQECGQDSNEYTLLSHKDYFISLDTYHLRPLLDDPIRDFEIKILRPDFMCGKAYLYPKQTQNE